MAELEFWRLTPRKAYAILNYRERLRKEAENPKGELVYIDQLE